MRPVLRRGVRGWWFPPAVTALVAGAVALGPALGPGLVQAYDLGWSPDPRFTPFVTGLGSSAARAVPSDAVGVLLGSLVGAGPAQKLVLLAVLVLGALGPVALLREVLPSASRGAACVTAVAGVWNPFVAERLVIGQWTVLLGYALVGWGLRAAVRAGRRPGAGPERANGSGARGWWACGGWAAASGLGGANTVLMTVGSMLLGLVAVRAPWRVVGGTALVAGAVSACWALPALVAPPRADPSGTTAFSATSDTPLGLVGSALSGGGLWNDAAVPPERSTVVVALAAAAFALLCLAALAVVARRTDVVAPVVALVVPGVVGLGLVLLSGTGAFGPVWQSVVGHLPGGALLRDSQKLLAPWVVLLAVGAGCCVVAPRRFAASSLRGVLVGGLVALPVALLPSMVWGFQGRLEAVSVPTDYRTGVAALDAGPAGEVGLLPWRQYRRYEWNGSRVSLTLLPRVADQRVLYDDSLPLSSGTIRGESPRAGQVSTQIAQGATAARALASAGVSYLVVEKRSGVPTEPIPADLVGTVLHDGPDLLVVTVRGNPPRAPQAQWSWYAGWTLSLGAGVALGLAAAIRRARVTKLPASLLTFRP